MDFEKELCMDLINYYVTKIKIDTYIISSEYFSGLTLKWKKKNNSMKYLHSYSATSSEFINMYGKKDVKPRYRP